jgi:signal transduction histidine kinase
LLRALLPSTITIQLNIQDKDATVIGDPVQIEQIIMNLGGNAGHAMRAKGGTLEIGVAKRTMTSGALREYPELAQGTHVVVWVRDTGPGIPREIQHRIFDPFFTTKAKGVGLGLSISYRIVQEHGGRLRFTSQPGRGTTFYVHLPLPQP